MESYNAAFSGFMAQMQGGQASPELDPYLAAQQHAYEQNSSTKSASKR